MPNRFMDHAASAANRSRSSSLSASSLPWANVEASQVGGEDPELARELLQMLDEGSASIPVRSVPPAALVPPAPPQSRLATNLAVRDLQSGVVQERTSGATAMPNATLPLVSGARDSAGIPLSLIHI